MALKVEGVVKGGMHAEEALSGSSRFEPLHLALASPYRLMRVLRPVVLSKPLTRAESSVVSAGMRRHRSAVCRVTSNFGAKPCFLRSLRISRSIPAALHQHVENVAFVIDNTPEIHPLAGDPNNHLIQMPAIARPRATLA